MLRLRFDDFTRATRSHTLSEATAHTETILGTARALLALATPMITSQGITLLGVSLSNLADDTDFQLTLPFERQPEERSTRRLTHCASGSDPRPSSEPCSSAATPA